MKPLIQERLFNYLLLSGKFQKHLNIQHLVRDMYFLIVDFGVRLKSLDTITQDVFFNSLSLLSADNLIRVQTV